MTVRLILGICLLAFAAPGLADDDPQEKVEIRIVTVDGDETVDVAISGSDMGFDLDELQVGENRSFTDDEGRNVLVTREEDGFRLDVDGTSVQLPAFDGLHGDGDMDVEVDVDKRVHIARGGADGITILSGKAIDDATRESIESVLRSAGYDAAVSYIDETSTGEVRKVIRMKK